MKLFKRWKAIRYAYDIKFEMLQVRENENSLRKWSDGAAQFAQLGALEGALEEKLMKDAGSTQTHIKRR